MKIMVNLNSKTRKSFGKKNEEIKNQGFIPAVVYGHDFQSVALQVSLAEMEKTFKEAGESTLIDLKIDEKNPIKVLIYDVQHDPLTNTIRHVDFYKIKAGEKIEVETELEFLGEAPAVKNLGGIIFHNIDRLKIKCLPENLVHKIEVDVSGLDTLDSVIRIKDLSIPDKIEVLEDSEEVVTGISRPQAEVEAEEKEKVEVATEEVKEEQKGGATEPEK